MQVIKEKTFSKSWLAATNYLYSTADYHDFNLILDIETPQLVDTESKNILHEVDSFLRPHEMSLHNVAETIFPAWFYKKYGWAGMREKYLNEFKWVKSHPANRWGTYAHRLLYRKKNDGTEINPLGECINKINRHFNTEEGKRGRATYELNILDENLDIPIYRSETDHGYYPGGPCMSHLSFKVTPDRKLIVTVLYRSHYYIEKALGNLLGISRLQNCICTETKLEPGSIVCVSTYAKLDTKPQAWGISEIDSLLKKLGGSQSDQLMLGGTV